VLAITACSAILLGLAAGAVRPLDAPGSGVAVGAACLGGLLAWPSRRLGWVGLIALVALGAWWASVRLAQPPDPLAELAAHGAHVALEGTLVTPPSRAGTTTRFVLAVDTRFVKTVQQRPLASRSGSAGQEPGQVQVEPRGERRVETQADVQVEVVDWLDGAGSRLGVGDRARAEGRLVDSPYTGRIGRHELVFPSLTRLAPSSGLDPRSVAPGLRAAAAGTLHGALSEPEGSLAAGLLLGGAGGPGSGLAPEFRQQLQRSGLSHLLAVDGYKQVLVAGALQVVAVRLLGRRLAAPVVLLGIAGYTLLTGASPSAVRAGLMLGLSLLAGLAGRVHDPLTGLLLAAGAMGVFHPGLLLELGFQLSFGATLGLILFYPRVRYLLRGLPRPVAEPAGLTLAVTLATLPVTLVVFQQVSLVSSLAHVVAVPLVPAVLLGAGLVLLAQSVPTVAGAAVGLCWLAAHVLAQVVRFFGGLPGAAVTTGHLPPLAALGLAIALLAWGLWEMPDALDLRRRVRRRLALWPWLPSVRTPIGLVVAALLGSLLVLIVRPDGYLHVTPLAVRRGAAVLVRGPTGGTALVVDGPVDSRELAEQVRLGLSVWERALDLAVVVDPADAPRLDQVLQAYPATQLADASADARLDLGAGAVLDIFAAPVAELRASYRQVSLALVGPALSPSSSKAEIVSDGVRVWTR
jgi:competence protein ComEC